jgi:hypothetical protein
MADDCASSRASLRAATGMGGGIDTVHLENGLGEIKTNRDDGHENGSLAAT